MHGSGGPARSFSRQREIAKKEKCMKRRKNGTALILLFAALLLMVGLTSCAPDPPTDAEALRGQWAVYSDDPDTPEKEEEFDGIIIDIQYTVPGYWCFAFVTSDSSSTDPDSEPLDPYEIDEATAAYFIKSNRTQSNEDGSFTISSTVESETLIVEYRFIDAERNTMEAKVTFIDETGSGDGSQSEGTENSETDVVIMKKLIDHEIKINADVLLVPGK